MDSRAARDTNGTIDAGRQPTATSHPLRVALLELLSGRATLTSTEAARELGHSSGACSFHLRQLERYGLVEEAPGGHGRVRPWRLAGATRDRLPGPAGRAGQPGRPDEFGELARELENEGYRRWLERRAEVPQWHDEAFSAILYLTPAELTEVAAAIRAVIAARADRDPRPAGQPATGGEGTGGEGTGGEGTGGEGTGGEGTGGEGTGAQGTAPQAAGIMPVAVVARMFPLLPASSDG